MIALPIASPSASMATVPDHCVVTETATIRASGDAATVCRTAAAMASHHASGSCSAPPPSMRIRSTGALDRAMTSPRSETNATLGPEVPRSIARTYEGTFTARTLPVRGTPGSVCVPACLCQRRKRSNHRGEGSSRMGDVTSNVGGDHPGSSSRRGRPPELRS